MSRQEILAAVPDAQAADPGQGPLQGILVRRNAGHWHLTTLGYSELDEKTGPDPDFSGYGMEMTWRLATGGDAHPQWAVDVLQFVATYAFDAERVIQPGDHLLVRSQIEPHLPGFVALLCMLDPELGSIETKTGRVDFIQVTAITEPELLAVRNGRLNEVLTRLQERDPLFVTQPERPSVVAPEPG